MSSGGEDTGELEAIPTPPALLHSNYVKRLGLCNILAAGRCHVFTLPFLLLPFQTKRQVIGKILSF